MTFKAGEERRAIIIFFKPECRHCLDLLANLATLIPELNSGNTQILSLSIADSARTAEFLQKYRLPFPVYHDERNLQERLEIRRIPTVFLVDDVGIIRHKWVGKRSKEYINEVLIEFAITSRIPIHALSEQNPFPYSRSFDGLRHVQSDTALASLLQRLYTESSDLTEVLGSRTQEGYRTVDEYVVYGKMCDCEEQSSGKYTLVALSVDPGRDSLLQQHLAEDVTMAYIDNYLESHFISIP